MRAAGHIDATQISILTVGMTEAEVRTLLGDPIRVMAPDETITPSKAFQELGSQLRLSDDENVDVVWLYGRAEKARRQYCLGFSRGRLTSIWKITKSE